MSVVNQQLLLANMRIDKLEGLLADVRMQANQLALQYGGGRRDVQDHGCEGHVPSDQVVRDFRVVEEWAASDPAGREKPPMFATPRAVRGPLKHQPSRQQRRRNERKNGTA